MVQWLRLCPPMPGVWVRSSPTSTLTLVLCFQAFLLAVYLWPLLVREPLPWRESTAGELRSHMPRGMAKNNQTNKKGCHRTQITYLKRLMHSRLCSLLDSCHRLQVLGRQRKKNQSPGGRQGDRYGARC